MIHLLEIILCWSGGTLFFWILGHVLDKIGIDIKRRVVKWNLKRLK
jgi:hypothetical protein